jgi:DNA-binding NarL/FixJ family response regulator
MSSARRQAASPTDSSGVAALVAGARNGAAAAEILAAQGLGVEAFDRVEDLLDEAGARRITLIVLCSGHRTVSLPRTIERLASRFAEAPVVLLCAGLRARALRAAVAAGAAGAVLEEDMSRALGPCVAAARAGQLCLPRHSWKAQEPAVLSAREKQVLGLLVMGYMNCQIAEQLFLAESTVKSHLSSAFTKLGVHSRNEAVARILDPQAGLGMGILALGSEPLPLELAEAR